MRSASAAIILAASTAMVAACARGGPAPVCVPGAASACTCDDGRPGARTCNVTGRFARCVCSARTHRRATASPPSRSRDPSRSCRAVAYHLVQLALRHLWDNPSQTPDEAEANQEMMDTATTEFAERCDAEPWSDSQRGCILGADTIEEVSACGEL